MSHACVTQTKCEAFVVVVSARVMFVHTVRGVDALKMFLGSQTFQSKVQVS